MASHDCSVADWSGDKRRRKDAFGERGATALYGVLLLVLTPIMV
jgi:hypothetical protein